MKVLLTFILATAMSCTVQKNQGLSYKSAIVIHQVDPSLGASDEFKYLKENYPGYQVIGRKTKQEGSRYYEIFYLRDDHVQWVVYFDITKFHDNILP